MDRGFWISWHDLPDEGRDEHIAWLHQRYIPTVLKRPGVLWGAHYQVALTAPGSHMYRTDDASVPQGSDHVVMFGGADTGAFNHGVELFTEKKPSRLVRDLTADDRKMLAMRRGERQCILAEEIRVHGPAGTPAGVTGPGPCIQLGSFNCPREDEDELLAWYVDFRLPAVAEQDGFRRARKLVSTSGWAKHVILYEFDSRAAREIVQKGIDHRHPDGTAWTRRFIPALVHAPRSPVLAERVWPKPGT